MTEPSRHCGRCGYDVRGLPTTICPECGGDLERFGRVRQEHVRHPTRERWLFLGSMGVLAFALIASMGTVDVRSVLTILLCVAALTGFGLFLLYLDGKEQD